MKIKKKGWRIFPSKRSRLRWCANTCILSSLPPPLLPYQSSTSKHKYRYKYRYKYKYVLSVLMAPSLLLPPSRRRPSSMFMFLSPSAYIPHSPNAPHSWIMVPENTNSEEEKAHILKADRIITATRYLFVQWPLKELLKVGLSIQPAPDVLLAAPIPTMLL